MNIYESFYNPDKKETAHKSYTALGYVQDLIDAGIPDPIAYYSDVVKQMNIDAKRIKEESKARQIAISPERHLGYFLLQNIYSSLYVSDYLDLMQTVRGFRFKLSDLIEALIYSRVVDPCSKSRTCHFFIFIPKDRFYILKQLFPKYVNLSVYPGLKKHYLDN